LCFIGNLKEGHTPDGTLYPCPSEQEPRVYAKYYINLGKLQDAIPMTFGH
jgi:hypothetical protein